MAKSAAQLLYGPVLVSKLIVQWAGGRLEAVDGAEAWRLDYDQDGNLVAVGWPGPANSSQTALLYQAGRVVRVAGRQEEVTYSRTGALTGRAGYQFRYNGLSQLVGVWRGGVELVKVWYDAVGRPVRLTDSTTATNTSLLYSLERPWAVAAWSDGRALWRATTDRVDRLVALHKERSTFFVISDPVGSPHTLLDTRGRKVKQVSRAPLGAVTEDTNEEFRLPVGFHGGLELGVAGLLLIRGRPYDSLLGQWMVPDLAALLHLPQSYDVTDVHLYRFNKNDPFNLHHKNKYMDTLTDWLRFFGYDQEKMSKPFLAPHALTAINFPKIKISNDIDEETDSHNEQKRKFFNPNIQEPYNILWEEKNVQIGRAFHLTSPMFPNIILRKGSDMLLSHAIEGANSIELLMAKIVNNTALIEDYGEEDTLYFMTEEEFKDEDIAKLKRVIQITETTLSSPITQVCFQTSKQKLCGLSGLESVEQLYKSPSDSKYILDYGG